MKIRPPFPAVFIELPVIAYAILILPASHWLSWRLWGLEQDQVFNLLEGVFWIALAAVVMLRAKRSVLTIGAAATLLLFGVSDFIEVRTRAWYTPWSLFALKAACVLSLLVHAGIYWKRKRDEAEDRDEPSVNPPDGSGAM